MNSSLDEISFQRRSIVKLRLVIDTSPTTLSMLDTMTTPTDSSEMPIPESTDSAVTDSAVTDSANNPSTTPIAESPTFVKLAMRNMVRQGGKSIYHFALTTVGLLGLLVGLAFITR
jgi:Protein of unknown function (DUF3285)